MKKLLTLIAASSLAFYMQACSDSATSADDEVDLVSSSSEDEDISSSSKAKSSASKNKSSSSKAKSSSSKVKSSDSKAKSSSSVAKSSDSKAKSSSSVAKSSDSKAKSSSSVAKSSDSKAKSSSSVAKSSDSKAKSSSSVVKSSSSIAPSSSSVVKSSSSVASSSSKDVVTAYVFGSDYTSGELRWVINNKISEDKLPFNQDSKIIPVDGNLFVLERYGADNLALVDMATNTVKWQIDLGANANPSDLVKANKDEVWLALDGEAKFVKVAVKDGKITKTVKTEAFAQAEGQSPHLVDFEVSGDTLFALFQRYTAEGWTTSYPAPGLLAMYKLSDGTLLDTIGLAKKNPVAMGFAKGKLYVGSMAEYNNDWGTDADDARGIEVVDFAKKTSSMVVDGVKLGGGIYAFVVDAKNAIAYASIYKVGGNVPVAKVDLASGSVEFVSGIPDAEGSLAVDAAGVLYVGDRSYGASALYVYDAMATKISAPTSALPPYSIAIVK